MPERFTLDEARTLSGPMVYALCDEREVFYIGRTKNPAKRFYQYSIGDHANVHLTKRLRESAASVRVEVLEAAPENLASAELTAIRMHGATLLNKWGNPARLSSGGGGMCHATCPQCGSEIDKSRQRLCQSCTGKALRPQGKSDLRALAAKAVAEFRKTA